LLIENEKLLGIKRRIASVQIYSRTNNGRKIELMEEEKFIVVTDQLLPFQISIVSLLL
jgi:predicted regulator of amino acid metabolism with ACT domain